MNTRTRKHLQIIAAALAASLALPFASAGKEMKEKGHGKKTEMHRAIKATTVEGMDFLSRNDQELGSVNDIVFSTETGKIKAFVIGTGIFGLGGPEHLVSAADIEKRKVDEYNLHTNFGQTEFDAQPRFSATGLRQVARGDIRSGELLAVDLIGQDFTDREGVVHGEVHDWIVDVRTGQIPYVIVREPAPLPGMGGPTGMLYYAFSTDLIEGVRDGNLVARVDEGEITDAEMISDDTPLQRAEEGTVYQFRYEPEQTVSAK